MHLDQNKRRTSKWDAYLKSDDNLTVTKIQYTYGTSIQTIEQWEKTGSPVIYKIIHHDGGYLLLFGKSQWHTIEISYE